MVEKPDPPKVRIVLEGGPPNAKRRAAVTKLIIALTVALPGIYSAFKTQGAADADKVKATVQTDRKVADRVSEQLTKNVQAVAADLKVVKATCVTSKDLLALVTRLRRRRARPRSPALRAALAAREAALERQLAALKVKQAAGARAIAAAREKPRPPKLRPASVIRRLIQKKAPAPTF